jgi:integrase
VLRVSLPAHEPDKVFPLTVKQVEALADAVPARCRAMVIPQAGLGLRISELLGLRGDDVLWLERMVKIDVQRDRHTMGLGPLKTPGSRRKIPLPQVVTDALSQHIAPYPPAEDGAIFTMENGEPSHERACMLRGSHGAGHDRHEPGRGITASVRCSRTHPPRCCGRARVSCHRPRCSARRCRRSRPTAPRRIHDGRRADHVRLPSARPTLAGTRCTDGTTPTGRR